MSNQQTFMLNGEYGEMSSYNNNKTVYIFVKLCNFKAAVTVLAVWFVIQNL